MSHVVVHRIDDIARRRIAAVRTREWLDRMVERRPIDPWRPWRAPFMSGWYPGTAGNRLGTEPLALKRAKEAALAAGADPAAVEELRLEDLIVEPEFISGSVAGVNFKTTWPNPTQSAAEGETSKREKISASQYEETTISGALIVPTVTRDGPASVELTSNIVTGPVKLHTLVIPEGSQADLLTVHVTGYGTVAQIDNTGIDSFIDATIRYDLNAIVDVPAVQIVVSASMPMPDVGLKVTGIALTYTKMRRRAA